jgi:hypothetical protein
LEIRIGEGEILLSALALTEAVHVELADEALELGVAEVGGEDVGLEERGVEDGKGSSTAIP